MTNFGHGKNFSKKLVTSMRLAWKEVKIRSKSLPWMNNTIGLKE
jgi:hypothetical protein